MVNIWAVLVIGVIYMVLGSLWYGPFLFGKAWGRIIGMDMANLSPEQKKAMQKKMWPSYFINFMTTVIMTYILALFLKAGGGNGIMVGVLMWVGFLMPMAAQGALWSGKAKKMAWQMFWLTAIFQLIAIVIAGAILSAWQ